MQNLNLIASLKEFFQYHFNEVKNDDDLMRHRFFLQCLKMILVEIKKIELENKPKERVSKSFLRIFYISIYHSLKDKVKNLDIAELDKKELTSHFVDNIEEAYQKAFSAAEKENIPDIFIEKFKNEHEEGKKIIEKSVYKIINTSIVKEYNNYMILDRILDSYLSIINFIMFDVEKVLRELNGELEKALKERGAG